MFTTAGDSFPPAFGRAFDAVRGSTESQRALTDAAWPGPPSGSTSANHAAVDSRIVRQSKSDAWVPDEFFDMDGVGALAAPIVGVGTVARSVIPVAHRRTRSLASRIPSVRASDQSSTAIC